MPVYSTYIYYMYAPPTQEGVDTIDVLVSRSGGSLEGRSVQYTVLPHGGDEFFGDTKVLYFPPGVNEAGGRLIAKKDFIPEVGLLQFFNPNT